MHLLTSRIAVVLCGILLFLLVTVALCGANSLACFSVMATDGLFTLGWLGGAIALGALVLNRVNFRVNFALFLATAGGLGLGIFGLLGLALGLLGWLNRPVAIALPVASAVLLLIDLQRRQLIETIDLTAIDRWLREPAGTGWLWLVPLVSLTIATISASLLPGILWNTAGDPHPYDVTSYHLLVPREWFEGGRIVPLSHNVFSYFPFNVEMQFLLLMHASGGPFLGMYACQYLCVGYAGLTVIAVFGTGKKYERPTSDVQLSTSKERGISSSVQNWTWDVRRWTFALDFSPILAAALMSAVPWFIMLGGVAYVESALMLYTALAIAWALEAIANPRQFLRCAIVSGVLAGLACGVKITAVPMLLLAVPAGLLGVLLIRRPADFSARKILIGCIALGLAGSVVLSPWLIRNFVWCRNPLFPLAMKTLGQDHFTDQQALRFVTAHIPTANHRSIASKLKVLWTDVLSHGQFANLLLPAGAIACLVNRKRQTSLIAICGLFVLVVWIGFTHLMPRFLVMLIPIAGIALGQVNWGRAWPAAIAFVLIGAGLGWSFVIPQLYRQSDPPPFTTGPQPGPRPALFGVESREALEALLMPKEAVEARDNHMQIALVGDAQAFLYQVPMSQLHYRCVFNVAAGVDDPIDAWVGPQVRGDPNWLLIISPSEIDRLHSTYIDLPAFPPAWDQYVDENRVFFLRGDKLPKRKN